MNKTWLQVKEGIDAAGATADARERALKREVLGAQLRRERDAGVARQRAAASARAQSARRMRSAWAAEDRGLRIFGKDMLRIEAAEARVRDEEVAWMRVVRGGAARRGDAFRVSEAERVRDMGAASAAAAADDGAARWEVLMMSTKGDAARAATAEAHRRAHANRKWDLLQRAEADDASVRAAQSALARKRLAAPGSATSRAAGESWAATYHRDYRDATRRRARADKVRDLQEGDRAAAARAAARAADTMREGVK